MSWLHLLGVALALVLSCASTGCAHRESPGASLSASIIRVDPDAASPGMHVALTTDQPVFNAKKPPRVQVGKQAAKIAETTSATQASIVVPNVAAGDADVRLLQGEKEIGRPARLRILPPQSERLTLAFADGRVKLIDAAPRAGGYTEGAREAGHRLSYDLVNEKGVVVFTGSILHPTLGRVEVFDETADGKRVIHGERAHARATFVLKIPYLPGRATVRFYDVPADVNLASEDGRKARTFLNEVEIGG